MKKNIAFLLVCFTIVFFSGGCSKKSPGPNNTDPRAETYFRFSKSGENVGALADSIEIVVNWSKVKWEITTVPNGFIKKLSATTGGAESLANSSTKLIASLEPNIKKVARSQELILTDVKTGSKKTFVLTQDIWANREIITIDPGVKFQKITGFGGMLNSSWTGSTQLTEQDIEKLYGSNGLGYNILRMMLYPNTADWGRESAIAKKAQELGATIFASPWTPPASMKSNGATSNKDGAFLLPEKYDAFAAHLKAFVDFQKDQGVNIYAVSVQNEPDWKVDYDGCSYSPQQMLDFVKNHGDKIGDGIKLMAAETVQFNTAYTDPLLNDPVAVNNIDIVATHLYGGGMKDYKIAQQKGKEIWMTEHLFNDETNGRDWDWLPSLKTNIAKEIHDCMVNNFNAYVWWYLKRFYSMLGENSPKSPVADGAITKRGYIIGHYAKYATGKTRIQATVTGAGNLLSTAYHGNNEITVVFINRNATPTVVEVALPVMVTSATAIETTVSKNMAAVVTELSTDKKILSIPVSAESIVSLRIIL